MSDEGARGAALLALPIEMLQTGRGYALGWSAPWGAAASIVERFAPEFAKPPVLLGTSDRTRTDPPSLFALSEGVAATWCQDDGAWLALLDERGTSLASTPVRIAEGARSQCIASTRGETHVFVEDGAQVRAIGVRSASDREVGESPVVAQSGRVVMSAAYAGDAPLLVAAYAGDRRLIVADGARGTRVRHELPREVASLDAHGAGGRVAFALTYEDGAVVEVGVIDREGKLVERRHAVLREPGARYADVRALWIEDDFHVLTRDAARERLVLARMSDGRVVLEIPNVHGPFAASYREKALAIAQAFADGDESVLRITRELRDRATREVREPAPPVLRARRAEEQTVRCIDELEQMLGASGYRDARAVRVAVPVGAALRLEGEAQQIELRPEHDRFLLTLMAIEPTTEPAPSVLARWWRALTRRDDPEDELGRALAAAIDGVLLRADRSAEGRRFEVLLTSLPAAAQLSEWLRRARALLAERPPP